jgi:electron transport complex protein RnfD
MDSSPTTRHMIEKGVDAVSAAAPLAGLGKFGEGKGPSALGQFSIGDLAIGNIPGVLGETCKIALILGGIYLIVKQVIDWRIPVSMIGSVAALYLVFGGFDFDLMLKELLSGGLILGAFFMATDYCTSPQTGIGRVIFGVGCGLILFVIRAFANYPEGCSFAILFMNVCAPLIDRWTMPKYFGEVKKHG